MINLNSQNGCRKQNGVVLKNKVNYLNTNSNVFFFCCSTTFIIQYGAVNECVKANKEREREREPKKNTTLSSENIKSLH